MVKFIDLYRIYERYRDEVDEVIRNCFTHQRWVFGPELEAFESEVRNFLGVRYAMGVSSGTDALVLSLRALAIKRGQEFFSRDQLVITTPFTFVATAESIIRSGASVLFVDIEEGDLNISVSAIEEAVKRYKGQVVGVVAVHLYGRPCRIKEISELCSRYNLFLVEDCAQAFGAEYNGRKVGGFGDVGAFSFFPTKNLPGIGDGGLVSTNDTELYEILTALRNHGGKDKYNIRHIGYNARLDTIQSAVLRIYLRHIKELISSRREIGEAYNKAFSQFTEKLRLPPISNHIYNLYTLQILDNRDRLVSELEKDGIGYGIYYPVLVSEMPPIKNYALSLPLPISQKAKERVLSLPCFPFMSSSEVQQVIQSVLRHLQRLSL